MRRVRHIFNIIMRFLGLTPRLRPQDIAQKLPPEVLAAVMYEAQFLKSQHGVEVRELEPGEIPDIPKPANGAVVP